MSRLRLTYDEGEKGVAANTFELQCRLVPAGVFFSFLAGLLALAYVSHVFAGQFAYSSLWLLLAQLVLICLVITYSVRLKVRLSKYEVIATSEMHRNSLCGRSERTWDDVHSIRLRRVGSAATILKRLTINRGRYKRRFGPGMFDFLGKSWFQQGFIIFDFRSGGYMPLPLAGIPADQLEEFFIYVANFADPMALNEDVLALQRDVLMGEVVRLETSYTQMWEESLRQRFEVTNFVPLQGGQELRTGDIQVLMQLASGGMSSVYLARLKDGTRVILKELVVPDNEGGLTRQKVEELFSREASILSKLNHPKIVRVYDHFVENGRNYLILDRAHGLTLRQQVQLNGTFSTKDAALIGRQLAEIAAYLHDFEPSIIHRDITPDNIVYDERNKSVTLIDFGAATELIGNLTGTLIGKQSYIPVEQFRGKAVVQSDVYAIGATLHFILTASDPVPITVSRPRSLNESVTVEMDELVAAATATEVEDRIASAKILADMVALCK